MTSDDQTLWVPAPLKLPYSLVVWDSQSQVHCLVRSTPPLFLLKSTFALWVCCANSLEVCQLRPKHLTLIWLNPVRGAWCFFCSLDIHLSLNQSISQSILLYFNLLYSCLISSICHHTWHTGAHADLYVSILCSIYLYTCMLWLPTTLQDSKSSPQGPGASAGQTSGGTEAAGDLGAATWTPGSGR